MVSAQKPLSQNAIGRALGLSSANMVKMKKQGCPMDSVDSVRAWREARQNIAARKPEPSSSVPAPAGGINADGTDPGESFDKARTRREISEANKSEMEVAELCGLLIRIDAVKVSLATAFTSTREALLQIPSRLAPLLAADGDPASVQNIIHSEIHNALHQLSGVIDQVGQTKEVVE